MSTFVLRNSRMVGNSARHDLYKDDVPILVEVSYTDAMKYCLINLADDDTYMEEDIGITQTGKVLREKHNEMERFFASDGSYTPEFY